MIALKSAVFVSFIATKQMSLHGYTFFFVLQSQCVCSDWGKSSPEASCPCGSFLQAASIVHDPLHLQTWPTAQRQHADRSTKFCHFFAPWHLLLLLPLAASSIYTQEHTDASLFLGVVCVGLSFGFVTTKLNEHRPALSEYFVSPLLFFFCSFETFLLQCSYEDWAVV